MATRLIGIGVPRTNGMSNGPGQLYISQEYDFFSNFVSYTLRWKKINNGSHLDITRLQDGRWLTIDSDNILYLYPDQNALTDFSKRISLHYLGRFRSVTQRYNCSDKKVGHIYAIGMNYQIYEIYMNNNNEGWTRNEGFGTDWTGYKIGCDYGNGNLIVSRDEGYGQGGNHRAYWWLNLENRGFGYIPSCCGKYYACLTQTIDKTCNWLNMSIGAYDNYIYYNKPNTYMDNNKEAVSVNSIDKDTNEYIELIAIQQYPGLLPSSIVECSYDESKKPEFFTDIETFSEKNCFNITVFFLFLILIILIIISKN